MGSDNHSKQFDTQHTDESNFIVTDEGRIVLTSEPASESLNDRQKGDYRSHRKRWL